MNNLKKQGFTLVEIMIVVMIIGLLAAIALPSFQRARQNAQTNTCINNLRQIDGAIDQWAIQERLSTGDAGPALADLVGPDSFIKQTPVCPIDGDYDIGAIGDDPQVECGAFDADTHPASLAAEEAAPAP